MKTKLLLITMLIAFSVKEAQAGHVYQYKNIKRFYPSGNSVFMIPEETIVNPAGCSKSTNYLLQSDHTNFEDYKELMLGAKLAGFKVGIFIHDDECLANYPKIFRMFIQ